MPTAANYDPNAGYDNGSCEFAGCTVDYYRNYTTYATVDDGNCSDAPPCPDSNGDGMIGALEITDLLVFYNTDGGGCGVLSPLSPIELGVEPCAVPGADCGDQGCTYANAVNFDPGANWMMDHVSGPVVRIPRCRTSIHWPTSTMEPV